MTRPEIQAPLDQWSLALAKYVCAVRGTSCKNGRCNIQLVSDIRMRTLHNELTRYKFCPEEGMKYMPRIRQYFGLPANWMPPPFNVKNYLNTGIDGLKGAAKFAPDNVD